MESTTDVEQIERQESLHKLIKDKLDEHRE